MHEPKDTHEVGHVLKVYACLSVLRPYYRLQNEWTYKKKFAEWKSRKSLRSDEMLHIIKVKRLRAKTGKQSLFRVRGVKVPPLKISRFEKRYGWRDKTPTSGEQLTSVGNIVSITREQIFPRRPTSQSLPQLGCNAGRVQSFPADLLLRSRKR